VRDGHRHRLNSQVLLKPPSLMLSLISSSDPLDRMAVAVFAMDPNRRVFDHHRVLSPAEVVPPTRRQALVDTRLGRPHSLQRGSQRRVVTKTIVAPRNTLAWFASAIRTPSAVSK
jgi:hypothetical protein